MISSLFIRRPTDEEKQTLFREIRGTLRVPGVILNIDQIRGDTDYLRDPYWMQRLVQERRNEPSEERIRESIDWRTARDRNALPADRLR